ncbi:MAG: hypothetical protein WC661_15015 [Opitutaceae bacterium]|jgi:hypothetical protein
MMIPDRSPNKVTIEDLLRLKRAERPSAEFWTRFEQDLRAKQLAAIVEKRPWWHALHLPQAARVISRFQVPVGSAAIFVLSFVVANQYRTATPSELTAPEVSVPAAQVAMNSVEAPKAKAFATVVVAARSQETPAMTSVAKPVTSGVPVRTVIAVDANALSSRSTELTAMIPWGVGQAEQSLASARLLDTGMQDEPMSNLSVTSLLGNPNTAGNQIQASRPQATDAKVAVAQVSSPREVRRAKILAGLVVADNAEGSDYARAIHSRDVAANDLNDAQLYDSVRRLGVGGDRFTLKF